MKTEDALRVIAQEAGVTAWVHATRVTGPPQEITLRGHDRVAIASLYKVPLAIAWADLVESSSIDPHQRLLLTREDRAPGPTGVSMLLDDITASMRDIVRLMLALSDNTAGDIILHAVGITRLHQWVIRSGLRDTIVRHGSAHSLRAVQDDTGTTSTVLAERALTNVDRDVLTTQYDAALASSSTAADLCHLLTLLWSRPDPAHALVRDAMAHQAWRHRIGSGFPHDDVAIHAKTGSLGRLRHEAAVITYPGEHPIAVAVLTQSARAERHLPRVDSAIGELAREATTPLRMAVIEH